MIKILVVDDEPIFVNRICMSINWELYGFRICCTAFDGKDALLKAESNLPDIALVDINMPYIDGLRLTQLLKEKVPDIIVVLISGHSEFEYAQKAVKLGVEDYILKPYEDEELISVLLRIKDKISRTRQERILEDQNKRALAKSRIEVLLSGGTVSDEELKESFEYMGIDSKFQYFGVVSIEIDNMYQKWSDISEISLWKFAVSNVLGECVQLDGKQLIFYGPEDRIVSINGFGSEREGIDFKVDQYTRFCKSIENMLHFTVTIGIGTIYMGIGNIGRSYRESVICLQNKLILGNNRVIEFKSLNTQISNTGFYPGEINNELLALLRQNNIKKIEDKIDRVFSYISEKQFSADYTHVICTGLISICLSFIVQTGNNLEDVYGKGFSPLIKIRSFEGIKDLKDWMVGVYKTALEYRGKTKLTKSRKLAEDAKVYIASHYNNPDLQIEDIAGELFVSGNYLMAVFKKEFGVTVAEYISNTRMLKAKELIASSRFKLSAVAEMVGFNDAGYFSKCFKKNFGITPSEYENEKRRVEQRQQ